jgi:hypothetical protein
MQLSEPVLVVQAFLDAYNARDLESFIGVLADDVLIEDDAAEPLRGKQIVHNLYETLFARDGQQKSTLLGRMTMGNYVVDKEYITGRRADAFTVMTLYRVDNGKISYMYLMRESTGMENPFGLNP